MSMLPANVLDQVATVYTEALATGAYTVVAQANLPCRLGVIPTRGATSSAERAELASMRRLVWGPGYAMPEHCQIEIDGQRWNPVAGTLMAPTWIDGSVVYRAADVVRVV